MDFLFDEEELPKLESAPELKPESESIKERTKTSIRYPKSNIRLLKLSLSASTLIILVLAVSLTMVLAQGQKEIIREMPMTINVIDDTDEFNMVGFYINPQADIPIETVAFGDVEQGVTQHFPIWVKNENVNNSMEVYGELVGDFDNWANPSVDPAAPVLLAPGEVQMFTAIIEIMPIAETGSKSFSFRIVNNEA